MGSIDKSSSEDDSNVFLGDAINIATRPVHTKLNKLILLRLPLAIPPRTDTPSSYIQGILHIAPLYISFESLWHAALHAYDSSPSSTSPDQHSSGTSSRPFPFRTQSGNGANVGAGPRPSPRMHAILDTLFIPGLLRASRLRSDLRALTGWSDGALQARLEEVATTGRLGEIVAHIRRAVERHPHVLLAYAWVLYMALFSGGRYIRASLESSGSSSQGFWTAAADDGSGSSNQSKKAVPVHGPLDFFHFATPQDGEDLKHEFKQRLSDLGGELTSDERGDIVREAICIFENLVLLIGQLDDVCHTRLGDLNAVDASVLSPRSAAFRIRDSVGVTRERGYRAAKRSGPQDDDEEVGTDIPAADPKETTSSSSSSSRSTSSEDDLQLYDTKEPQTQQPPGTDVPTAERHKSCHSIVLASSSPRVEKDDPFSRRRMTSESSNMDSELAERLARAMRFDPQLPVPERTTRTASELGDIQQGHIASDGEAEMAAPAQEKTTEEKGEHSGDIKTRKRGDSTFVMGVQVASALAVGVAAVVALSRG